MRYLWIEVTGAGLHFWKLVNRLFSNPFTQFKYGGFIGCEINEGMLFEYL